MVNIWRRQPSNRLFSSSLIKHKSSEDVSIPNQFWEPSGGTMHYLNLQDSIALTDTIVKSNQIVRSDSISLIDIITKQPQLPKSDTITINDSITKLPQIVKSDMVTLTDGITRVVSLNKADLITLSDLITKDVSLNKQDSISLIDSISKMAGLNPSDTIVLTDALIKDISLSKADIITLTDNIIKSVLIPLSDGITLSDSLTKGISINESDIITLSDLIIITPIVAPPIFPPSGGAVSYGGGGWIEPREYVRKKKVRQRVISPYPSKFPLHEYDEEALGQIIEPQPIGSLTEEPHSFMIDGINVMIDSLTLLQGVDWRKVVLAVKIYKMMKRGGL